MRIAEWCQSRKEIAKVHYPGLPSHPDHAIAKRLFTGFGGVVSFVLRADHGTTARALDACDLATIAPSLGGVETLIEQPAMMKFSVVPHAPQLAIVGSDVNVHIRPAHHVAHGVVYRKHGSDTHLVK